MQCYDVDREWEYECVQIIREQSHTTHRVSVEVSSSIAKRD
jgi:hypothetical protein